MKLHYFPLEPIKSRYTEQLCSHWMPDAFWAHPWEDVIHYPGVLMETDIQVGQVLDATGRGIYALSQVSNFLRALRGGQVNDGDVLYFQDFWTPGIEAIFYALSLHNVKVRSYAMCHAQSVDEFDFTYKMLPWVRYFERGIDSVMTGVFVASTIHQEQLEKAGFRAPIYVVGLPYGQDQVEREFGHLLCPKTKTVVYSSRLDSEKNPHFMMAVAHAFLTANPEWSWHVTTSAAAVRSNDATVPEALAKMERVFPKRFTVLTGLTKEGYYRELAKAAIQFNCSWQDYVSWTLLEATTFRCATVYPRWRSFPECLSHHVDLYRAFDVQDAVRCLAEAAECSVEYYADYALRMCRYGREALAAYVYHGTCAPYNIWKRQKPGY